jgi:hypothetical protein
MTAIAAVLALSSTAAFAQAAEPAADPSAPMIAVPPPPAVSEAPAVPVAADPAPMVATPSVAATPVESGNAQTVEPMATRSTPVVHTTDASIAATSRPASAARTTAVSRTTTVTTRSTTPAAAAITAPTPAPVAAPAPVLKPATPPAPATTATTRTTTTASSDNTLPIAGGVALGLIALGIGAFAFSRRRRDDDEVVYAAEPTEGSIITPVTPAYAAATEAVTAVPASPAVAYADADGDEQMTLANGFDLSRFGRHTRAAYRGPSPENPSLSLRKRLRTASFLDGRERLAEEQGIAPASTPLAAKAAKAKATDNDQIIVRPGYRKPSRFFGTAFQR